MWDYFLSQVGIIPPADVRGTKQPRNAAEIQPQAVAKKKKKKAPLATFATQQLHPQISLLY